MKIKTTTNKEQTKPSADHKTKVQTKNQTKPQRAEQKTATNKITEAQNHKRRLKTNNNENKNNNKQRANQTKRRPQTLFKQTQTQTRAGIGAQASKPCCDRTHKFKFGFHPRGVFLFRISHWMSRTMVWCDWLTEFYLKILVIQYS